MHSGGLRGQVMVKISSSQGDHGIGEVMTELVLPAHRLQIMTRILEQRRSLLPDTV